jgi:hypothetical protein
MSAPLPQIQLVESIFWKVFFPFVCIFALWPIYYLSDLGHPFQRTFAHGELLVYSTILMIEVYIGVSHIEKKSTGMLIIQNFALLASFGFLLFFGFLKFQAILVENSVIKFELGNDLVNAESFGLKLIRLSCINCSVAVLSSLFSILIFVKIRNAEFGAAINSLQSTPSTVSSASDPSKT